ncbi:autophagy-related protein 13-domain-containing protein [Pholiota molesta]|nr:autophagy-related protein 13-domain-containing protein [Pholiota molesta]
MSDEIQKADQIAFHFYTKFFYALYDARATEGARAQAKTDKWFNLETPDCDLFTKDAREPYRSISLAPAPGPPLLEIQVLLAVPELSNDQVLVYAVPDTPRVKVEPARRFILLEAWSLGMDFHNRLASGGHLSAEGIDVALPTIYKHGIVLFRSLFSLLRVLPAWKFYKRLKRRIGGVNRNGNLSIQLRVRSQGEEADDERDILKFGVPPAPSQRPLPTETHTFPPVPHLLGTFTLRTTYLTAPHFFQLDEREALLSSGFLSFDKHFSSDRQQGEGFLPTLERHRQRESISGSGAVAAFGAPLARSPPRAISRAISTGGANANSASERERENVVERFIIPSRVASIGAPTLGMGTSAITGSSALIPPPRPFPIITTNTNTNTTTTTTTTSANPASQAHPIHTTPPSMHQRLRRESLTSSTSSSTSTRDHVTANPALPAQGGTNSLSSSPSIGGVPIRRPGIHAVHPFKGNTLSSAGGSSPSLSIRQGISGSPGGLGMPSSLGRDAAVGGGGGGGHSRQTSTSSGMQHSPVIPGARLPPLNTGNSPAGGGTAWPSPPGHATTFAPSSLGAPARAGLSGLSMERGAEGESARDRERRRSVQGYGYGTDSRDAEGGSGRPQPVPVPMPPRRRYESSFGHRYVGSGGSGTGSMGIGGAPGSGEGSRGTPGSVQSREAFGARTSPNASFSAHSPHSSSAHGEHDHEEDKEISTFVQDIDDRKPLSGRAKERESSRLPFAHGKQATDTTVKGKARAHDSPESPSAHVPYMTSSPTAGPTSPLSASPRTAGPIAISPTTAAAQLSTSPQRGPMLTTESEIDERLRRMNETFLRSLEGISGGSTRRKKGATDTSGTESSSGAGTDTVRAAESTNDDASSRSGSGSGSGPRSHADPITVIPPPFAPGARLGTAFPSRGALAERDNAGATSPYGYFSPTAGLGLGLPARTRYASTSSSTLAASEAGASQGSEEVIGRLELDGDRRRWGYGS